MDLVGIDWAIIISFFSISFFIGVWVSKRAGSSSSEFFLSGRNMPWWLLGVSMVVQLFLPTHPIWLRYCSKQWCFWKLGLVGFSYHRFAHSICLCEISGVSQM